MQFYSWKINECSCRDFSLYVTIINSEKLHWEMWLMVSWIYYVPTYLRGTLIYRWVSRISCFINHQFLKLGFSERRLMEFNISWCQRPYEELNEIRTRKQNICLRCSKTQMDRKCSIKCNKKRTKERMFW
jgi:hypothetical protein